MTIRAWRLSRVNGYKNCLSLLLPEIKSVKVEQDTKVEITELLKYVQLIMIRHHSLRPDVSWGWYIYIYIHISKTAVFESMYILVCTYRECIVERFIILKTSLGTKKYLTCSHRKISMLNILKILHFFPHYAGWEVNFQVATLLTMQSICLYTDIYQGFKFVYIY